MTHSRILLVDDDADVLEVMKSALESRNFEVVAAANVTQAFLLIANQHFDVLITDLHMPRPGDGFAVVTAMRHSQPDAFTVVLSGFPDVQEAMSAIRLQADEVLVKPLDVNRLTELIRENTQTRRRSHIRTKESVASILERESGVTVQCWLARVNQEENLKSLPLSEEERTHHLPAILANIVKRLRKTRVLETVAIPSPSAVAHGELRRLQGYTAPMLVQESRILQVCIFETIQRNTDTVDFSLVLPDIMLIADEVDSQLSQTIESFLKTGR